MIPTRQPYPTQSSMTPTGQPDPTQSCTVTREYTESSSESGGNNAVNIEQQFREQANEHPVDAANFLCTLAANNNLIVATSLLETWAKESPNDVVIFLNVWREDNLMSCENFFHAWAEVAPDDANNFLSAMDEACGEPSSEEDGNGTEIADFFQRLENEYYPPNT